MKRFARVAGVALAAWASTIASAAPIPEKTSGPPGMSAVARKMRGVSESLARAITGDPTRKAQKAVLRDLDAMIAELEKECQSCRNGRASNRPMKPASDSVPHGGTGVDGGLGDPGASEKEWARLTPRERDRILQSMSEGFPPEYRSVLERYYRRLAEERSAASGKSADAP